MKCCKTLDSEGRVIRLDNTDITVSESAVRISSVEYKMLRVAAAVYLNGENPDVIRQEEWWK